MEGIAFAVVVGFPALSGAVFGVLHAGAARRRPLASALARYNLPVYAVLLVPAVVVGLLSGAVSLDDVGGWALAATQPAGPVAVIATGAAALSAGGLIGAALYASERLLWAALRPGPGVGTLPPPPRLRPRPLTAEDLVPTDEADARTIAVVQGAAALSLPMLVGTAAWIVVAEEVLWRAVLIGVAVGWGLTLGTAVAMSAGAFALNHVYFGGRNALAKGAEGAVWAGLFLVGGLLAAVASHLVFNLLAFNVRLEVER